uniref:Uncharacterized protein n=1 Tax=Myotis myotis TaxID=51298 RepID=A0A7J7SCD1_MYOMY|nr:hypothetical protein mMyoMyo1_009559 [Myotis myotis]
MNWPTRLPCGRSEVHKSTSLPAVFASQGAAAPVTSPGRGWGTPPCRSLPGLAHLAGAPLPSREWGRRAPSHPASPGGRERAQGQHRSLGTQHVPRGKGSSWIENLSLESSPRSSNFQGELPAAPEKKAATASRNRVSGKAAFLKKLHVAGLWHGPEPG